MAEIARDAVEEAFEVAAEAAAARPRRGRRGGAARGAFGAIAERWNKKPICHVHVLERVRVNP